jgi:hypothetical protein
VPRVTLPRVTLPLVASPPPPTTTPPPPRSWSRSVRSGGDDRRRRSDIPDRVQPPLHLQHADREVSLSIRARDPYGCGVVALNHARVRSLDFVTHSTSAVVHDAGDIPIMQTLEALPYVTRTARGIIARQASPDNGGGGHAAVRARVFRAILYQQRSFYQDGLGTNVGKALKERDVLLRKRVSAGSAAVHPQSRGHRHPRGSVRRPAERGRRAHADGERGPALACDVWGCVFCRVLSEPGPARRDAG